MSRLLIVSNRLPVTVKIENSTLHLARSVGGLATGLKELHEKQDCLWLGWPGDVSRLDDRQRQELDRLLAEQRTLPVYLKPEEISSFYEGFSNGVLWPLFHYQISKVRLDASRDWQTYQKVNELFADLIAEQIREDDWVWIHDYQLALVPEFLRQRVPEARIGFFLHIPFPSPEVFRILPWRSEILRGLLGADLIGFHTHSYLRNFSSSLRYLLGINVDFDLFWHDGRPIRLGAFPMGVDASAFAALAGQESVLSEVATIQRESGGRKLLLAVDRLDYTKGLRRRLLAIERFLQREPSLRDSIRFIQIAVPSRTKVESYNEARKQLDEMVGRINGAFSTAGAVPIHYLYRALPRPDLVALYRAADIMLVTPLRDGMNLVAKEFIASRPDGDGILILSEFAGAAAELGEAIQINPYDIDRMADAIRAALGMPQAERRARMSALSKRVFGFDVHLWAITFLDALRETVKLNCSSEQIPSPSAVMAGLLDQLAQAPKRYLLLDYDGTLVPFADSPSLATPDQEMLRLLESLAACKNTSVHVVSGRPREVLEQWLGRLPIGLHAEHGFWSRLRPAEPWMEWQRVSSDWKQKLLPVLEMFTARTPGSLIEEKSTGIAWHYRMADPDFGALQARELQRSLMEMLTHLPIEILLGDKIVEFRLHGVHKGVVVPVILSGAPGPFLVLALGDDRTDEELFAALPAEGIAIHVGPGQSRAPYRLRDSSSVRRFLGKLLNRMQEA